MADTLVRTAVAGGVATLTLDSPHNRNALSSALISDLVSAMDTAGADDAVRVIVLSHTGSVFCSGADLKETAAAFASGGSSRGTLGDALAAVGCEASVARVAARAGGLA
jgi:methylglutaconyl-CoA hydratase